MDGGMPTWGSAPTYQANLEGNVKALAPTAPTWNGPQNGVEIQQIQNNPKASTAALPAFLGKVASIGEQSAHIIGGAADWVFKQGESMVKNIAEFPVNAVKFGVDAFDTYTYSRQQDELSSRLQTLMQQYRQGSISKDQYNVSLKEWQQDNAKLSENLKSIQTRITNDSGHLVQNDINTAAAIVTVMTAGMGAPETAAAAKGADMAAVDYLSGDGASAALKEGEQAISKIATNKNVFSSASETVQGALRRAVTSVLYNSAPGMTSSQIARATTTNLLLNYPLTYNALSSTGQQVFQELQGKKYGDATRTMAFNAALLLSGGPIGQALKYGGKALGGISDHIFGSTPFLDTLSGLMGDRTPQGLFNVIKNDPELTKNFAALEATNMAAEGGNATKAAYRIVNGLSNAGWGDVSSMSHETFAKQVNGWANSQRALTQDLIKGGMSEEEAAKYVVGRWTVEDVNNISAQITKQDQFGPRTTTEEMLQRWNNLKDQAPGASWANNQNLNKEITSIISSGKSPEAIDKALRAIPAQVGIKGVTDATARFISKQGYVGIEPFNLEAPFKEGKSIATKFAAGAENDFFVKSTSPLPVLGSLGSMLTGMGMSPNAAGDRVYELFSQNLSRNLASLDMAKNFVGSTPEKEADLIAKKLGDYARTKTTKLFGMERQTVTDYRQFTLKDIQKALGYTKSEAMQVRGALMDSMLEVPLSVRGLGDKIMDANYKFNPLAKGYAKLQGATRFAWNPFFQMRVSYKAEFLSQMEANGKFPTLLGTNKILQFVMPEKYKELDHIANVLESNGVFGAGYAAEGADEAAAGYHALGHTLLTSQKRSIAGLVGVMADKTGMDAETFVQNYPNQTRDVVRMILQYNPRANFLNSPMARTINYAFFPFRFNLKVASIMARTLQKQPAVVQFGVIKGLMQAHQYLNSPEGMAWYSKNSDVIGMMKYFSPAETISSVMQSLGAKPGQVGAFGELGGLPFGWIPQLLSTEGLVDFNQPYVNPKTGVVAQNYIPASARGRLQAAIQDFVGALFTYPGATVGLPSKTTIDVNISRALVPGGNASDFNKVTPTNLTPQQQQFQQEVEKLNGTINQAKLKATPQENNDIRVPAQPSSIETNPPARSTSSTPKKKKAQFTPELMPGQTQLGVIPGSS